MPYPYHFDYFLKFLVLGVKHTLNPYHLYYLLKYQVMERLNICLTPITSIII